jgi:uncharacterized membrane protein
MKTAGLAFLFLWFLIGGIAHFVATAAEMRIVPPYIPWPRVAVLVSGVFELLGAVGLVYVPTRRAAGVGLFALTIAVTPVHIYMLQQSEQFDVPYWLLVLRLPLQCALLALIAFAVIRAAVYRRRVHRPFKMTVLGDRLREAGRRILLYSVFIDQQSRVGLA